MGLDLNREKELLSEIEKLIEDNEELNEIINAQHQLLNSDEERVIRYEYSNETIKDLHQETEYWKSRAKAFEKEISNTNPYSIYGAGGTAPPSTTLETTNVALSIMNKFGFEVHDDPGTLQTKYHVYLSDGTARFSTDALMDKAYTPDHALEILKYLAEQNIKKLLNEKFEQNGIPSKHKVLNSPFWT